MLHQCLDGNSPTHQEHPRKDAFESFTSYIMSSRPAKSHHPSLSTATHLSSQKPQSPLQIPLAGTSSHSTIPRTCTSLSLPRLQLPSSSRRLWLPSRQVSRPHHFPRRTFAVIYTPGTCTTISTLVTPTDHSGLVGQTMLRCEGGLLTIICTSEPPPPPPAPATLPPP